jgi:hypothetical protein
VASTRDASTAAVHALTHGGLGDAHTTWHVLSHGTVAQSHGHVGPSKIGRWRHVPPPLPPRFGPVSTNEQHHTPSSSEPQNPLSATVETWLSHNLPSLPWPGALQGFFLRQTDGARTKSAFPPDACRGVSLGANHPARACRGAVVVACVREIPGKGRKMDSRRAFQESSEDMCAYPGGGVICSFSPEHLLISPALRARKPGVICLAFPGEAPGGPAWTAGGVSWRLRYRQFARRRASEGWGIRPPRLSPGKAGGKK